MNRIILNNIRTIHPYHVRGYRHAAKAHKSVISTYATVNIGELLLGIKNELSQLKQEIISIHARIDKLDSTLNARVIKIISGTMLGCVGIAASLSTIYNFFTTSQTPPENRRAD